MLSESCRAALDTAGDGANSHSFESLRARLIDASLSVPDEALALGTSLDAAEADDVVAFRALDLGALITLELVASRAVESEASTVLEGISRGTLDGGALASNQLLVDAAGDLEAKVASLDLAFTADDFLADAVDQLEARLALDGDALAALEGGSLRAVAGDDGGDDRDGLLGADAVLQLVAWWARDGARGGHGDLGANQTDSLVTSWAVLNALDVLVVGEAFRALQSFNVLSGDLARAAAFLLGAPGLGVPGGGGSGAALAGAAVLFSVNFSAGLAGAALLFFFSADDGGLSWGFLLIIILDGVDNGEGVSLATISSSVLFVELLAVLHLEGVLAIVSAAERGGILLLTTVNGNTVSSLARGPLADLHRVSLSTFGELSLP